MLIKWLSVRKQANGPGTKTVFRAVCCREEI